MKWYWIVLLSYVGFNIVSFILTELDDHDILKDTGVYRRDYWFLQIWSMGFVYIILYTWFKVIKIYIINPTIRFFAFIFNYSRYKNIYSLDFWKYTIHGIDESELENIREIKRKEKEG